MATFSPSDRARLVDDHAPLARMVARRFIGRGEPLDDLVQVAMLALLLAIDRFDPTRGLEFSTFAVPTIAGELKRYLRDRGWVVRPPRRLHDLYLDVERTTDDLAADLGRSPTTTEVARTMRVDAADVRAARRCAMHRDARSLDMTIAADGTALADSLGGVDPAFEQAEVRVVLPALLRRLSADDRHLLELRFGRELTQRQIASLIGTSQMDVSRRLARICARLRAWIDSG